MLHTKPLTSHISCFPLTLRLLWGAGHPCTGSKAWEQCHSEALQTGCPKLRAECSAVFSEPRLSKRHRSPLHTLLQRRSPNQKVNKTPPLHHLTLPASKNNLLPFTFTWQAKGEVVAESVKNRLMPWMSGLSMSFMEFACRRDSTHT